MISPSLLIGVKHSCQTNTAGSSSWTACLTMEHVCKTNTEKQTSPLISYLPGVSSSPFKEISPSLPGHWGQESSKYSETVSWNKGKNIVSHFLKFQFHWTEKQKYSSVRKQNGVFAPSFGYLFAMSNGQSMLVLWLPFVKLPFLVRSSCQGAPYTWSPCSRIAAMYQNGAEVQQGSSDVIWAEPIKRPCLALTATLTLQHTGKQQEKLLLLSVSAWIILMLLLPETPNIVFE